MRGGESLRQEPRALKKALRNADTGIPTLTRVSWRAIVAMTCKNSKGISQNKVKHKDIVSTRFGFSQKSRRE